MEVRTGGHGAAPAPVDPGTGDGPGRGRTWRVYRHELASTARNPSFLVALAIQCVFVMICLVVVLVLVNVLFPGGMNMRVRYPVGVYPAEDSEVTRTLAAQGATRLRRYDDLQAAHDDFQRGRLCALVIAPPGLDGFLASDRQLVVSVVADETKLFSTVCRNYVMSQLATLGDRLKLERGLAAGEVLFVPEFAEDPNYTFHVALYFFMIPFAFVFPCFVMATLAIDLFTPELEGGVAESLLAAVLPRDVVYGRFGALVTLSFAQFVFWVAAFSRHAPVFRDPLGVLAVSTCLCALVIAAASALISQTKDRSAAYVQFSLLTFAVLLLAVPLRAVPGARDLSPVEVFPRLFFGLGSWALPAAVYALLAIACIRHAAGAYGPRPG